MNGKEGAKDAELFISFTRCKPQPMNRAALLLIPIVLVVSSAQSQELTQTKPPEVSSRDRQLFTLLLTLEAAVAI